jgi:antitoxin component of RelBE/YafQ-DinJ toxin-antitoxin module
MSKKVTITIRLDEDLFKEAKYKADKILCMPLATLIRVFLKAFTTQKGIGFFVGEQDLVELINKWIHHRQFERESEKRYTIHNNRLRDIFDLKS